MLRIDYITKECFKNKEVYNEYLKLVEEAHNKNVIVEKKNPLDRILKRS